MNARQYLDKGITGLLSQIAAFLRLCCNRFRTYGSSSVRKPAGLQRSCYDARTSPPDLPHLPALCAMTAVVDHTTNRVALEQDAGSV